MAYSSNLMLRRHFVKLVDATASLIGQDECASLQIEVTTLALTGYGHGQPRSRGCIPTHEDTSWGHLSLKAFQ